MIQELTKTHPHVRLFMEILDGPRGRVILRTWKEYV